MDQNKFLKNIPLILFLVFILGPIFGNKAIFVIILLLAILFLYFKFKNSSSNGASSNPWLNIINKIVNSSNKTTNSSNPSKYIDLDELKNMNNIKRVVISTVLVFFGLWLFFASIVVVDAGETGVYSLFGKVKSNELSSGFHLVIPLAKVTKMSIRTEEYTMSAIATEGQKYGMDAITSLTKEGLSVDLDMTILYHLEEEKASDIYSQVGEAYPEKIIRPIIRTIIRDIIAQYDAKELYSAKRGEASKKIQDTLSLELGKRGIIVESVLLRNISLPANLATSIQEKLQAEQEAQKYDFILQKEKKEKERKIIEAEGQRDAQKIINESLTNNYLYYLYVSDLKSRQGTIYVPTSPTTGMPIFKDIGK